MTLAQLIERVDEGKPNAFSNDTKTAWVNEVEGMVQTQVFLFAPETIISYAYEADKNTELLVNPPHDKLYAPYLEAKIDYANGEYEKYNNSMQMFNSFWSEFCRWFALVYRPADTHCEVYQNGI